MFAGIVISVLSGLIVTAILAFVTPIRLSLLSWLRTKNKRMVNITFSAPTVGFEVSYSLRFVREGKDKPNNITEPINKDYSFIPMTNHLSVSVETGMHEFQFKCYATCDPENIEHFIKTVSALPDFEEVELDKNKIWFLLSKYERYITPKGYVNNYFSKRKIKKNPNAKKHPARIDMQENPEMP